MKNSVDSVHQKRDIFQKKEVLLLIGPVLHSHKHIFEKENVHK